MSKQDSIDEPTKEDVENFVQSQLYDMEAFGFAHKDTMVDGIMELLKKQNGYCQSLIQQEVNKARANMYNELFDAATESDYPLEGAANLMRRLREIKVEIEAEQKRSL